MCRTNKKETYRHGKGLWHPVRIHLFAKDFARICGFSSIEIMCCTLYLTRIYLDACKFGGVNLNKNGFSDSPQISVPVQVFIFDDQWCSVVHMYLIGINNFHKIVFENTNFNLKWPMCILL